jgi:DNA-binding MarR family transcriptional regulator
VCEPYDRRVAKRRQYFKDYVLLELAVANAFASQTFDRELVRLGLNPSTQVGVLALIHQDGPITPTGLEQRSGLASTTLRERVQGLIEAGFVERIPNEADRRSHFLDTTQAGDDFLRAARQAARAAEQALGERTETSMDDYRRLLVRLREACQEILAEDATAELRRTASA